MDRSQALYSFWHSFGLEAYDETDLPDDATMPYITYETEIGDLYTPMALTASIWARSTEWHWITDKVEEIFDAIGPGGITVPYTGGMLWIKRGAPFAQRIAEPGDREIRRYYLNIEADHLSA